MLDPSHSGLVHPHSDQLPTTESIPSHDKSRGLLWNHDILMHLSQEHPSVSQAALKAGINTLPVKCASINL